MSTEHDKAIVSLETKMDLMIKGIDELKTSLTTNYVQKVQFDDLTRRLEKIENAPHKWISTTVAVASFLASIGLGVLTLILK